MHRVCTQLASADALVLPCAVAPLKSVDQHRVAIRLIVPINEATYLSPAIGNDEFLARAIHQIPRELRLLWIGISDVRRELSQRGRGLM